MPLEEITDFNELIDNKPIQQEIHYIVCIIKIIINSLVETYQDNKIRTFLNKSVLLEN